MSMFGALSQINQNINICTQANCFRKSKMASMFRSAKQLSSYRSKQHFDCFDPSLKKRGGSTKISMSFLSSMKKICYFQEGVDYFEIEYKTC